MSLFGHTVGLNNSSHIFIALFKLPVFVVLIIIQTTAAVNHVVGYVLLFTALKCQTSIPRIIDLKTCFLRIQMSLKQRLRFLCGLMKNSANCVVKRQE